MGPRERLALRYVLTAVFFLGVTGLEGMLMRLRLVGQLTSLYPPEHYYSMMSMHPFVGIYGWAYMAVMGAFYFLVPFVLKKDLYSERIPHLTYWTMTAGVLITWLSGFFLDFAALYTLYWPLPVVRFPPFSVFVFSVGMLLIFASVLAFFFNMFATMFSKPGEKVKAGKVTKEWISSAFSLDRVRAKLKGTKGYVSKAYKAPVFTVGVFRGCVDTTINAVVMLGVAGTLAVFSLSALMGNALSPTLVDPLWYKNVFWWGLDMIADGNVLIFTAATWYFLVPMLVNRRLYGEQVVRTVILADLIVSLFVWNHHMLADPAQPISLQIQGQIVTWGELITMGLTMFAVLATIWKARPVKYGVPLAFVMASLMCYMIGGSAGILQANYALNRYLHNTQWVIGIHAHIQLLGGLTLTLFAAIYALAPILTGKEMNRRLAYGHLLLFTAGALVMGFSQGFAGVEGMLRRTIYPGGDYNTYMWGAATGGMLMAAGFTLFLVNFLKTYGFGAVVAAFKKAPASETPANAAD